MSDLPERIWATSAGNSSQGYAGQWYYIQPSPNYPEIKYTPYIRSDLLPNAPAVGYSRADVVGAMEDLGMWCHDSTPSWVDIGVQIDKIVANLTPAAEVPIPTVDFFEVAGEWSVKEGFTTWYEEHGAVVRNFCRYLTKGRGGE